MVTMTRAYTDEEITEATRLLLEMRGIYLQKNENFSIEKYNALNMALEGVQYLPRAKKGE